MKECDNSKIHITSNFILSISLLTIFNTLLLRPSLHCNTPLHFTTLQHTSPHFIQNSSLHLSTLHFLSFNPLNPELNPICYLLALLAHHFLHVSRIRVKSLTIRLLILYIYIYTHIYIYIYIKRSVGLIM